VNEVRHILATLNASRICEGNSESQYTSLPSIHEGILKNQSNVNIIGPLLGNDVVAKVDATHTGVLYVYHIDCEVLIESSIGPVQCQNCPSSHINYSCLTNAEKDEQLRWMHTESKIVKLHLSHLEKKISDYAARDGTHLD